MRRRFQQIPLSAIRDSHRSFTLSISPNTPTKTSSIVASKWQFATSLVFTLLLATISLGQQPSQANSSVELRVMSFNIRNGKARDGANAWEHRKSFACDVIRKSSSDIVGLQEAFRFQLDEIKNQLPEFDEVGEGRDGGKRGEYSAILFQRKRFALQDSGTFWLSNTPDVKSRHWGNRYLRICTWARLQDRQTKRSFYVYNTHFDHQSQNARMQSAILVAKRIQQRKHSEPFILTGDFNAGEENPVILYLKGSRVDDQQSPTTVIDTFRQIHPEEKAVGTGGGFQGQRDGKKIDYIFVAPKTEVLQASIVRTQREGRYPSDHFPVTATVRLLDSPNAAQ